MWYKRWTRTWACRKNRPILAYKQKLMSTLVCVSCQEYVFHDPYQCDCGDRLCGKCYNSYVERAQKKFICLSCNEENIVANCFRDKAVEYELRNTTLKCLNQSCPWEGESRFYQEHKNSCKFGVVQCTNSIYGCKEELIRSQLQDHLNNKCNFNPITCRWCGQHTLNEDIHIQKECEMALDYCPNECGERLPRREMLKHTKTVCTQQVRECDYKDLGCTYKGTIKELTKHAKDYPAYHNQLLKMANKEMKQSLDHQIALIDNKTDDLKSEISKIRSELQSRLQPVTDAVVKAESSIIQLQDGLSEVSLLLQTLQAASYDGTFIWKIPEVTRRRQEARTGKTVSLYSAPFYTSRHGYKLCLRLYMNGDGTGKGTHLSFFITLMRGEYDALLPWPFRQAVTLTLVDQNKQRDIVQSFRPEPTSSSFQRPRNEMNVASGCPTFALVSALDNVSYVKDDTLFLKCKVNTTGLTNE
ncbi:TNF receptor-associated factor 3-like isoform X2 [Halichondria panicea]|uniref:TNF receptor-associated factor 3-like isoform X2 n=1 Tax=Halichondria panicea TaxID=6063 RepID=UPI00312B4D4B